MTTTPKTTRQPDGLTRRGALGLVLALATACGRPFQIELYRTAAIIGASFVEASRAEVAAFGAGAVSTTAHIGIQRTFWTIGHALIALRQWLENGDGKNAAAQVGALIDAIAQVETKLIGVSPVTTASITRGLAVARATLAAWSMIVGNIKDPAVGMASLVGEGKELTSAAFDALTGLPAVVASASEEIVTMPVWLGSLDGSDSVVFETPMAVLKVTYRSDAYDKPGPDRDAWVSTWQYTFDHVPYQRVPSNARRRAS